RRRGRPVRDGRTRLGVSREAHAHPSRARSGGLRRTVLGRPARARAAPGGRRLARQAVPSGGAHRADRGGHAPSLARGGAGPRRGRRAPPAAGARGSRACRARLTLGRGRRGGRAPVSLTTARNIGIIALLAAVVAFAPGGGTGSSVVLQVLSIAFLASIAFFG